MDIQELSKYKVTSIRTKTGFIKFGKVADVVDEGRLFRIQELYVIWKSSVADVQQVGEKVTVIYKDGETIEIGICEK